MTDQTSEDHIKQVVDYWVNRNLDDLASISPSDAVTYGNRVIKPKLKDSWTELLFPIKKLATYGSLSTISIQGNRAALKLYYEIISLKIEIVKEYIAPFRQELYQYLQNNSYTHQCYINPIFLENLAKSLELPLPRNPFTMQQYEIYINDYLKENQSIPSLFEYEEFGFNLVRVLCPPRETFCSYEIWIEREDNNYLYFNGLVVTNKDKYKLYRKHSKHVLTKTLIMELVHKRVKTTEYYNYFEDRWEQTPPHPIAPDYLQKLLVRDSRVDPMVQGTNSRESIPPEAHQSLDIESIKLGKIDKKRIIKKYAQYRYFYILLKYEDLHGACREREIVLDDYEKYEEKENGETREARKSSDQKFSSLLLSSIPQRPTNQEIQEKTAPNLMVDIKDSLATKSNVKLDKAFSLENIEDKRKRTTASIVQRSGQSKFRQSLLEAYNGRCAITGCDVEEALDAAHIHPYSGSESDRVSNGLLLRVDYSYGQTYINFLTATYLQSIQLRWKYTLHLV